MAKPAPLKTLAKVHFALEGLPDEIAIPAVGPCHEAEAKRIEQATLDDLAFALNGIEDEFNAVGDRLHAVRGLYILARRAGGRGTDVAVAVAARADKLTRRH